MKILRLTTSSDYDSAAPVEARAPALLAGMLQAATGEPANIIGRVIWPAPELPANLDRWLTAEQPDVVFLWVNPFWYAYPSAPLKLERMGGPFRWLGRAGRRASDTPWLSRNPAFVFARRLAFRLVGGAYYFEPEEVAEIVAACVRRILHHEHMVALVYHSPVVGFYDPDVRSRRLAEERRRTLNELLHPICRELRAMLDARDEYEPYGDGRNFVGRDGMHPNALAQAWMARQQFPSLVAAWHSLPKAPPVSAQP